MIRVPCPRPGWLPAAAALAAVLAPAAACGKKGPPLAPLQLVPARVDDVVVRRLGDDVYVQFTVPAKNSDGTAPADVRQVTVWALTRAEGPGTAVAPPLDDREFRREAAVVGQVEVEPHPARDAEGSEPQPTDSAKTGQEAAPPPDDPRPAQGERAAIVERLGAEALEPWQPPAAASRSATTSVPAPAAPAGASEPIARTALVLPLISPSPRVVLREYAVAGESRRDRVGPLSPRVAIVLGEPPPAPSAPVVTYNAEGYRFEWREPAGVRRAPDVPAGEGWLQARPLFAGPSPHTYNVYELQQGAPAAHPIAPAPLNQAPLREARFESDGVRFGVERCFVVRTVEAAGRATVESPASPPTCVTARDTFAPPAPANLAAVGSEGAINLIWEGSQAADLAGYLVVRGEGPDAVLQALTPAPVRETTFRDTTVVSGVRYVYAVVAVDTADPPNVSPQSNRVEETAR